MSSTRPILEPARTHSAVRERIAERHRDLIDEVEAAVCAHAVVVGMRMNPFPREACEPLRSQGIEHHTLTYGSYFCEWRRRGVLKMWTGWPTFPMVFVKGTLVGGYEDLRALSDSGELKQLLSR